VNVRDGALQLLLIIDYIFDWARDMYRESIIRSLRALAVSDSGSLAYHDSDIFSTAAKERVRFWSVPNEDHATRGEAEHESAAIRDALRSFDTKSGVIRDIRYIQTRFLGLYVTQGNLDAFLRSASTEQESKALALSLLTYLLEGWRVKGETLDALEFDWTGKDRGRDQSHQDATFLVVAAVAAYLSPDWEQTRELSYLAVEEGALEDLLNHAGRRLAGGHELSDLPFVDKDAFSDILLVLRRQSAGSNLLACISRVCLSTAILSTKEEDEHRGALSVISVETSDEGFKFRSDTVLKVDTATKRDFVRALYDQHKVGRNEPFCPFLRGSSVLDELGISGESPPLCSQEIESSRWFKRPPELPRMPDHGVLIASSSNPVTGSTGPRLCLFVTDPAGVRVNGSQFQELLQSVPPWHFRARRYDNRRGWSNGWNAAPGETVTSDEPIMHRLMAFVDALKTLGARSSREGQEALSDPVVDEAGNTWAPKKANSMWDVLLTPGLEFMSDAIPTSSNAAFPEQIRCTPTDNPRNIRQVNREDTPRPSVEPRSKGKQPEVIPQLGFAHYAQLDNGRSAWTMAMDQGPGPSHPRPTRSESIEVLSVRPLKRQCLNVAPPANRDSDVVGHHPESMSPASIQRRQLSSFQEELMAANRDLGAPVDDETFERMLASGHFSD
jgi:hypothetical protein